jgi:hypothetical protein
MNGFFKMISGVLSAKMRKLVLPGIGFAFVFSSEVRCQKVFPVQQRGQADILVYVVKYPSQADLLVYKVDYPSQAKGNEGRWFFAEYPGQADKKLYFVSYESQADLKIYFADYASQAGWKNRRKMYLLE